MKGTPLEGSKIYLGGTAATYKDMQEGANWDLLIAGIAALALIFIIMLIITRAVVASAVIVGTVMLSLGASFGLSVLVWQHLLGYPLHWMVLAMSVIILLAVGADYNLLLVARFKEEIHAGLKTGIIRSMAGTGSVVTSAGLVFAFTMATMAVSDLRVIGQVGTTIGLGLLFDTLVIRSFMTPSIAALLGKLVLVATAGEHSRGSAAGAGDPEEAGRSPDPLTGSGTGTRTSACRVVPAGGLL